MRTRIMQRRQRQRGMTLVEITIAMFIMALMMTIAWSTIQSASNARQTYEAIEDRNAEVRTALARMVRDIESAYLSTNEDQTLDNRRTFFIGKSEEMRFSSFGHVTLWADSDESDQTIIAYFKDDDREKAGVDDLFRKELRRESNEPWEDEPHDLDVLMKSVDKIEFEYWNWQEKKWQQSWDSTKPDGHVGNEPSLPSRVRITITYKNARGDQLKLSTQARPMMRELLRKS